MIHEIAPYQYHIEYTNKAPAGTDYVICIAERDVWMLVTGEEAAKVPTVDEFLAAFPGANLEYLFAVDETACYTVMDHKFPEDGKWIRRSWWNPGECGPSWMSWAVVAASQIVRWMDTHRICGRCGAPMVKSEKERAYECKACGNIKYPRICPAIMLGITDGNRLLLTQYANRGYARYAMIAGFTEVGETIEEAAHREAMEEVGLKIKNLRYFTSQPWCFTDTLLMGFYADVDGDPESHPDGEEIAVARWFEREDIPMEQGPPPTSLAYHMINAFKNGEV